MREPHSERTTTSRRKTTLALFLAGLSLRIAFVLWKKTYIPSLGSSYPFSMEVSSIAAHLARGQGYSSPFLQDTGPTAWVAPVYPILVSLVFRIFGVYSARSALVMLALQCIMAAGTGVAIYALGKRTFGPKVALWAAWIWTLSPFFFRWPVSWIWDFAASALLVALILIAALDLGEGGTRKGWLMLGALGGITALTNPALLSIFLCAAAFATFENHRHRRSWLKNSLIATTLAVLIVSPWAVRNELVFGHPVFLRSNFWFEFHLGNYHYSNGMGYFGYHPGGNPREFKKYTTMGELAYIQQAKENALEFVRQYPREFVDLTLHRAFWFWDGTPLLLQAHEWWKPWEFWPLSISAWLGLIFVLTRRPRGWFLYVACLLVYPLPYYFVYPISKYRHAIEPEMLLLTVYLVVVLWSEAKLLRVSARTSSSLSEQNISSSEPLTHEQPVQTSRIVSA